MFQNPDKVRLPGPVPTAVASRASLLRWPRCLNGNAGLQDQAAKLFGRKLTNTLRKGLPTGTEGWRVLPVVARRDDPVTVIGEEVKKTGLVARRPRGGWTETKLIDALTDAAAAMPRRHGGLILFIDEMGKFLEAAAMEGSDIYILQQLAEAASAEATAAS